MITIRKNKFISFLLAVLLTVLPMGSLFTLEASAVTQSEIDELELPQGSIIYFQDGAIKADFTFAEWDPFNVPINAPIRTFRLKLGELGFTGMIAYSVLWRCSTPWILITSVPAPLILAPILPRKLATSTTCGSLAAFSMIVLPLAITAAIMMLMVAPTETLSR